MNGILIIDKSTGLTSHDVVNRVRRVLKIKRVGHTGTLDPFATGVMVVLVGQATRLAQFLDKDEKEYEAVLKFGFETDTGDKTGIEIGEWRVENEETARILSSVDWQQILGEFRGEIEQVPPMFSAKKIDGKKLYEHARKGVEVERKAVKVNISKIEIVDNDQKIENSKSETWNLKLNVACSAGTYIRQLAVDIGRKIGIGAHLTELRRTRAGRFDLSQSVTLDELAEMRDASSLLIPMAAAIDHLATFNVAGDRVEKIRSGLSTRTNEKLEDGQFVRILDDKGLLAVGIYSETEKSVRPKIVLI